jgi:hypothetical protein
MKIWIGSNGSGQIARPSLQKLKQEMLELPGTWSVMRIDVKPTVDVLCAIISQEDFTDDFDSEMEFISENGRVRKIRSNGHDDDGADE